VVKSKAALSGWAHAILCIGLVREESWVERVRVGGWTATRVGGRPQGWIAMVIATVTASKRPSGTATKMIASEAQQDQSVAQPNSAKQPVIEGRDVMLIDHCLLPCTTASNEVVKLV